VTRILAVVAGVLVLAGGLVALVVGFSSRDDAGVERAATGPGRLEPDRGARHLTDHQHASVPAGTLPTSGPHSVANITHDGRRLNDDQILHALELGDVVLAYSAAEPPAALRRLQRRLTGPFDAELAAAGQAVVLARIEAAGPAAGLAWRRQLEVEDPADPRLQDFAEAWLGQGAPR
jgi:Protein of unknown function (DUF3105)